MISTKNIKFYWIMLNNIGVFIISDGFNHELQEKIKGKKLLFMQFYALLIKRFHHFKRSKKGFLCEVR